jgi:IS30 family transposase
MPGARLTQDERDKIQNLFGEGYTFPQIAVALGRDRSSIWREVNRNNTHTGLIGVGARHPRRRRTANPHGLGGAYRWAYSARAAQKRADRRAKRTRAPKLRPPRRGWLWPPLWAQVKAKLELRWSPVQIARWLREQYPDQPERRVSHETIYQAIFYQARGGMRQELARQVALRCGRVARKPQSRLVQAGRSRKPWTHGFHISTRPAEITDRAVPGHWEGDLILGARNASAIITLVERQTRYVLLGALPNSHISDEVITVLIGLMSRLPEELRKTLTWDQGVEMAQHATFTLATDCKVYFCDPHSPWQRGSNENTNGLLRQYFPKGTDLHPYTQDDLDAVARELNGRPRQTLDWHNPAERLNNLLVATAA